MASGAGDDGEGKKQFPEIPSAVADDVAAAAAAGVDAVGTKELRQFQEGRSEDDLRKQALHSEHNRTEDFKKHFGIITVAALYIMAVGVLLFAGAWVWHLLMPKQWHWLGSEQITHLQNLVTGGVVAGLISDQFRKRTGTR